MGAQLRPKASSSIYELSLKLSGSTEEPLHTFRKLEIKTVRPASRKPVPAKVVSKVTLAFTRGADCPEVVFGL